MTEHAARPGNGAAQSHDEYEPPAIEILGTVEELTQGTVAAGGDLNTLVITF